MDHSRKKERVYRVKAKARVALVLAVVLVLGSVFTAEAKPIPVAPDVTVGSWSYAPNASDPSSFTLSASAISVAGLSKYQLKLEVLPGEGNPASGPGIVTTTAYMRRPPASVQWTSSTDALQTTLPVLTPGNWVARLYVYDATWGERDFSDAFLFVAGTESHWP